jgi:Flp pilus assembly secretin CpaC
VKCEIHARFSKLDPKLGITVNGAQVLGFRTREIHGGVEVPFGQTAVMAGLLQHRMRKPRDGEIVDV